MPEQNVVSDPVSTIAELEKFCFTDLRLTESSLLKAGAIVQNAFVSYPEALYCI